MAKPTQHKPGSPAYHRLFGESPPPESVRIVPPEEAAKLLKNHDQALYDAAWAEAEAKEKEGGKGEEGDGD